MTVGMLVFAGSGEDTSPVRETAHRLVLEHTALDPAPPEALPFTLTTADFRGCAGKPACFAKLVSGAAVQLDLLLVLSTDVIAGSRVLAYRLISLAPAEPVQLEVGVISGEPTDPPAALVPIALAAAFGGRWDRIGSLEVDATPRGAQVSIGLHACVAPCRIARLEPGEHLVEVAAAGYVPVRTKVVITAGSAARLAPVLAAESARLVEEPWFWIVTAAAAATTALAVVLVVTLSSGRDVCFTRDPGSCP